MPLAYKFWRWGINYIFIRFETINCLLAAWKLRENSKQVNDSIIDPCNTPILGHVGWDEGDLQLD